MNNPPKTQLNRADLQLLIQRVRERMFCEMPRCGRSLTSHKEVLILADYGPRGPRDNIICSECFDDPRFQEALKSPVRADMIKAGKLRFIDARRFNKQGELK